MSSGNKQGSCTLGFVYILLTFLFLHYARRAQVLGKRLVNTLSHYITYKTSYGAGSTDDKDISAAVKRGKNPFI